MKPFYFAHACDDDPYAALDALCAQLPDTLDNDTPAAHANGKDRAAQCLGLIYLNRAAGHALDGLLERLIQRFNGVQWAGAMAEAVVAGEHEYGDAPAIAAMIMPLPAGSWQIFSGTSPLTREAQTALVHADPATPDLVQLIEELARRTQTGYLFGGITNGQEGTEEMIAGNRRLAGGLSGVGFDERIRLLSRVTQGCSPLAAEHTITGCTSQFVNALDGEPALDVLLADLGVDEATRKSRDGDKLLRALPAERLRRGLLVGLNDTIQDRSIGFGDYMVRNLVGIDPENRMIAVAAEPAEGDKLVFCTRDRDAARADLIRVCTELRDEVESESLEVLGAHFVSCVARGESLFGAKGAETQLLKHNLGDVPIIGFYANGEVARERLYGYTGVLTLFVRAA